MKYISILCIAVLSMSFQPIPATTTTTQLSIQVVELENSTGQVILDIFSSETGFPTKPEKAMKRVKATIKNKTASFNILDLPKGEYAFVIIHDENMNNELDANWVGMPSEGLGVSNNAKGRFGPPSYKDSKFNLTTKTINTKIVMQYL